MMMKQSVGVNSVVVVINIMERVVRVKNESAQRTYSTTAGR